MRYHRVSAPVEGGSGTSDGGGDWLKWLAAGVGGILATAGAYWARRWHQLRQNAANASDAVLERSAGTSWTH
ncbi:hypothetical protein GCM10009681_53480 [Luedemannella helvata]|uniref:Uncharacterized protein n=1 Tax=Luedemannella helvata TaxID=349315 RepID=A0ABP4XCW0_9ACTN